ncbi:MAG: glycosyltransferase family 4 protein [Nitrospira sp.]|nr:glycosyltransferase family 4 protein [Nitrospira sp.]
MASTTHQIDEVKSQTNDHRIGSDAHTIIHKRTLKVLHLSTYDMGGGAARAANRLHAGLLRFGVDSSMFVREARTKDSTIILFEPTNTLLGRVKRRIRRDQLKRNLRSSVPIANDTFEPFRIDRSEHGSDLLSQLPAHDILNIHWVADFLDYPSFFSKLATRKPIVWTLHDMNPFTGGCHYDLGCGRYMGQCGECPQLAISGPVDLSHQIWERKKALFEGVPIDQLHIVSPSRWLGDQAKQSPILGRFPVSVIPYGLDLDEFSPRDKRSAREVFGVPQEAKVVLFVADGVPLVRKGFEVLMEALEQIKTQIPNLCLVTVGHNSPSVGRRIWHINVGHVNNDRLLSNIYSAADILALPSRQDNLPNTVLEAMACGTPVVGFDVGGVSDMIEHGRTGLLVPPGEARPLGMSIRNLLKNNEWLSVWGDNCRRVAVRHFSLEQQATCYADLYGRLLEVPSSGK